MHYHFLKLNKICSDLGVSETATEVQSVDAIKARMDQVQVVGVTCLGVYHPLLAHKKFDTCIMDEAGQITLPVGPNLKCMVI
jgi:superfamily I DNA and/or RNA helicase